MGISYAPFEDTSAPKPPVYDPLRLGTVGKVSRPDVDATECNYLIFFFIAGLFVMALTD